MATRITLRVLKNPRRVFFHSFGAVQQMDKGLRCSPKAKPPMSNSPVTQEKILNSSIPQETK